MSLICKCDSCGKLSGMVPFSSSPIAVIINNYQNHKMRIMVDVKIEHENFISDVSEFKKVFKDYMSNLNKGEQPSEIISKLYDLHNKINSPDLNNPLICDHCKKTYAYQILTRGFTNATEIKRPQLTDVDWESIKDEINSLSTYNNHNDDYDDYDEEDDEDYNDDRYDRDQR